jgi:hypothetical protein
MSDRALGWSSQEGLYRFTRQEMEYDFCLLKNQNIDVVS